MPDPIPLNAKLDIRNGMVHSADRGGERLIRQYAATRKAIKEFNE